MSLNMATLKKDNVSPEWISMNLGPMTRKFVYVNIEGDFNDTLRIYKESVLQNTALSGAEKEKVFDNVKHFTFVPSGYVTFFFRLRQPALVKMDEFKVIFNDKNGNSLVDRTIVGVNKVTVTVESKYDTSSAVSYNYYWLMKMKKPFTRVNHPEGVYTVQVVYPNGQEQVFEIKPD